MRRRFEIVEAGPYERVPFHAQQKDVGVATAQLVQVEAEDEEGVEEEIPVA